MKNWLHILGTLGPSVLAFTPAAPFIPAVIAGIKLAESRGGTGAEKKAIALETAVRVAEGIHAEDAQIISPQALATTVSDAIDTVVDVTNLVHRTPGVPA